MSLYKSMKGVIKMTELQVFKNEEFGEIRTIEIDNEPWFVGKDVAEALGYKNVRDAIKRHVDEEDKGGVKHDTLGGEQNLTVINESGLYSLILSSKLQSAKKFKRWVTSEVIPNIRKHGAYMTPETVEKALLSPDFLIQIATKLKEEQEHNKQLTENLKQEQEKTEKLTVENAALGKSNSSWDRKSVINALMRSYGAKCCGGVMSYAYGRFYKELSYKHHIDLRKRKGDAKGSYINYLKENEFDVAVQTAATMCTNVGIDIAKTINSVNAEAVKSLSV